MLQYVPHITMLVGFTILVVQAYTCWRNIDKRQIIFEDFEPDTITFEDWSRIQKERLRFLLSIIFGTALFFIGFFLIQLKGL